MSRFTQSLAWVHPIFGLNEDSYHQVAFSTRLLGCCECYLIVLLHWAYGPSTVPQYVELNMFQLEANHTLWQSGSEHSKDRH